MYRILTSCLCTFHVYPITIAVHIHLSGANLQGLGEEGGVAVSAKVLIQEIQAKVGRKTWFL